jgi:hypothetical protein
MSKWHCAIDGAKYGPVSAQDLRNWLMEGRLKPTDHVWTEGMDDWAPYNTVEELNSGIVVQDGGAVYVQGPDQIGLQQGNGLAVAGMVLGIVSLVLVCLWFISLPCAIVGLCLSAAGKGRARETNSGGGMAVAGIALSCVTLALLLIILLVTFFMGIGMMERALENMPRHR